jgi:hypothetical protein
VGRYVYSDTEQVRRWLEEHRAEGPVARWITECLLDEDCEVDSLGRNVTRVPGTKIDVTWLEAAPFRHIKVLWIEEDEG